MQCRFPSEETARGRCGSTCRTSDVLVDTLRFKSVACGSSISDPFPWLQTCPRRDCLSQIGWRMLAAIPCSDSAQVGRGPGCLSAGGAEARSPCVRHAWQRRAPTDLHRDHDDSCVSGGPEAPSGGWAGDRGVNCSMNRLWMARTSLFTQPTVQHDLCSGLATYSSKRRLQHEGTGGKETGRTAQGLLHAFSLRFKKSSRVAQCHPEGSWLRSAARPHAHRLAAACCGCICLSLHTNVAHTGMAAASTMATTTQRALEPDCSPAERSPSSMHGCASRVKLSHPRARLSRSSGWCARQPAAK